MGYPVAPVLWRPEAALVESSTMTGFMRWLESDRGLSMHSYEELWRWSVSDIADFWGAIWRFFDVVADGEVGPVLESAHMPGAGWFPGARLSYAEHVMRGKPDDQVAIMHASELRDPGSWTWADLREQVSRIRAGLAGLGVGLGDRVVAFMPNLPETIAAFLATSSLGATWSSCSPDFGASSVVDRFAQIEPKVLLAVDGYRYGGKDFAKVNVVTRLQSELPSLEHVVVLPYLGDEGDWAEAFGPTDDPLEFVRVPFAHPLWILFSSGTTGPPKAIVHGHGGILLEHLKQLHLHLNAQAGDRIFWFTTTGWMMWNFLVSALLTPAGVVLYDGNPGNDGMTVLWDLAERTQTTCFGTSAAFIHASMKAGIEPAAGREMSSLKSVGSTGSPLSAEGFRWVYEQLGSDTWLFSMSGGSDVCSAFVGGTPLLPVRLGELQARALGADVRAFDDAGRELVDEVGELVVVQPMPSMPVGFWGDVDGSRYREAYFDVYPGIWRHGDWIRITAAGGAVISGRSDSTINRGGIRMGTAEIYRAALGVAGIQDALVVDVPDPLGTGDAWMPLFVVLADGEALTDTLVTSIRRSIRSACSPRHVPDEVIAVPEIPRTVSGKVLEVPIKRLLMGSAAAEIVSRDSLANPKAFDWFSAYAAARDASPR
ncbi:MAG TPA: acetoacetate--CoA ligase [Solirubrobacteraceae bacterium]|nr:acetoacetate--CoA ligase [Solirubrobacteraceae bacterium]